MTFKIQNSNGLQGPLWDETYATREVAEKALLAAMGWDAMYTSHAFACDDGTAVCCYPSIDAQDNDQDDTHGAPRVVWAWA